MSSSPFPLPIEFKLRKLVNRRLSRESRSPFLQDGGLSLSYIRVPFHPSGILVDAFKRSEECIVFQPLSVLSTEEVERGATSLTSILQEFAGRFAEKVGFKINDRRIVDLVSGKSGRIRKVSQRQKALLSQRIQIKKEWIARECREALVRRIAIASRIQWQHLPDPLSTIGQEFHKLVR